MTEDQWVSCRDPALMLDFVYGRVSERKQCLLACGLWRLVWQQLDERTRNAVSAVERFLDGAAEAAELKAAGEAAALREQRDEAMKEQQRTIERCEVGLGWPEPDEVAGLQRELSDARRAADVIALNMKAAATAAAMAVLAENLMAGPKPVSSGLPSRRHGAAPTDWVAGPTLAQLVARARQFWRSWREAVREARRVPNPDEPGPWGLSANGAVWEMEYQATRGMEEAGETLRWRSRAAGDVARSVAVALCRAGAVPAGADAAETAVLRDIAGPLPFRPVHLDPARLPECVALARSIYDTNRLDWAPALADALERAGCTDPEVLDHLRGQNAHVRGCWVIDLLLGHASAAPLPAPADGRILFRRRDRAAFWFLSISHPASWVFLDKEWWPTAEHWYHSRKSPDPAYRKAVLEATSPATARRLAASPDAPGPAGRDSWFRRNHAQPRADWEEVKLDVMRRAVQHAFTERSLASLLAATGTAELVNDVRSDGYWGIGPSGNGSNWLGRLLMEVRAALADGTLSIRD